MKAFVVRVLLVLCLLLSFEGTLAATPRPAGPELSTWTRSADAARAKIAPEVQRAMRTAAGTKIPIIVTLKKQANLSGLTIKDRDRRVRRVVQLLQDTANAGQRPVRTYLANEKLRDRAGLVTRFWVFNGLSVSVDAAVVDKLAARPDVARISANETLQAPPIETTTEPEINISTIQAPKLWNKGHRGQGIVVANVDTGVYLNHDDLSAQWRGGSNSWFDPNNEHPDMPSDRDGHGTQTMGVIVGRDAGGTSIGVAPDAQWIAVKIFDDQGRATTAGIHAAYQWLLDPDKDPQTADAPHVVNNSWSFGSPGCNLEFQLDLQALRAANILPVFSAGNSGPYGTTSTSPANYPEAFAVGAVDDLDQIYTYSSRGPSSCGEPEAVFPEIVAPGVAIRTAQRYNLYADATGTSAAAPHVAGALALLLSAYPNLTAQQQADALLAGAIDLGPAGSDNTFGAGRLDVWASYQSLLPPPPPPAPDANLALKRPATVSSFGDDAHTGDKAVDGRPGTLWQTARAFKKNAQASEWIVVDLGSSTPVGTVKLSWGRFYATRYTIQVSNDVPPARTWSTLYNTRSGHGGKEQIDLEPTMARYIKLDSTRWNHRIRRIWLREIEVYAPSENPPPATTVHVGDLDGEATPFSKWRWNATATILVHDANETPVAGAKVRGVWLNGARGRGFCVTDEGGQCEIVRTKIRARVPSATFVVKRITVDSMTYTPANNHDPDGESDGTTIEIAAP